MKNSPIINLKARPLALTIAMSGALAPCVHALPIELAQTPLEVGNSAPPNVLVILDDSGSMDWEMIIQGGNEALATITTPTSVTQGSTTTNILKFNYGNLFSSLSDNVFDNHHPSYFGSDGRAAPTMAAVQRFKASSAGAALYRDVYENTQKSDLDGIWRARNSAYNSLYYNPEIRYQPWVSDGTNTFTNSNPSNAKVAALATKTVNLTAEHAIPFVFPNPNTNHIIYDYLGNLIELNLNSDGKKITTIKTGSPLAMATYLPMYYVATDSNNNGLIDANECSYLVNIAPNSQYRSCDNTSAAAGAVFPRPSSAQRTDCSLSGEQRQCSAEQELQNFANWFTYYRRREFASKAAFGSAIADLSNIRLGYTTVNAKRESKTSIEVPIESISQQRNTIIRNIYNSNAGSGGTHLITTLDEAGKYYSCSNGESLSKNIFAGKNNNQTVICPIINDCQRNFTLLMTDGFWEIDGSAQTQGSSAPLGENDQDGAGPFDGDIFAADGDLTLADVAMYYYENDLDGNSTNNNVPMTEKDKKYLPEATLRSDFPDNAMHQHMSTFTIGFGVFGDSSNDSRYDFLKQFNEGLWLAPELGDTVTWPAMSLAEVKDRSSAKKGVDLIHTALNGRGNYYSTANAETLSKGLKHAFESFGGGGGSIGAPSFNTESLETNSAVYTANFDAKNNSGDVLAYAITENPATSTVTLTPKWKASTRLKLKIPDANGDCDPISDTRNIVSYLRNANTGAMEGADFALNNTGFALSTEQKAWLRGHNNVETPDNANSPCQNGTLRNRPADTSLIGDIIHSRPLYVGPPAFENRYGSAYPTATSASYKAYQEANKNRVPVVAVGTNGGMFHVFNSENGDELMAYLPGHLTNPSAGSQLHNDITDLSADPYSHKYYVDLSPAVNDAFIKPRGGNNSENNSNEAWRTIAIGGYRAGGKGYFALDLTNTSTLGASSVMWEFTTDNLQDTLTGTAETDAADEHKRQLGYSFSAPLISMVNEKANVGDPSKGNKWQAIFANGYNSPLGDASLFIIDIDGAYDGDWAGNYRIIRTDSNPAAGETANGLSAPRGIDTDNNGTVDYVYAGDLKGNIWRFDLTTLPTDTLSNARKTKIFSVGNRTQAITTQPLVIKDPSNADQYIVVVSTGQWLTSADASSTYVQSIYGIVDKPKDPSFTAATKAMLKGRLLQDKNVTIEGKKMTLRNIVEDGLSGSLDRGWYIDLSQDTSCSGCILSPNGERAIRNMVMRGGYTFVNTVFPAPQNSCSASQGGATMSFNPLDGLMEKPMFDLNNDTFFNDGIYAGIVNNDGSGSDSAMIGKYLVSQPFNSDGSINLEFLNTNTDTAHNTGRRSWRQIH